MGERQDMDFKSMGNMSQARREKLLRVWDGCMETLPLLWHFSNLRRCDEALDWLIRNHFTGKIFAGFCHASFPRSMLGPMKWVLAQVDREKAERPIIAGRDYRVG